MRKNKQFQSLLAFSIGLITIPLLIQAGGSFQGNRIVFPEVREILKAFFHLLGRRETYAAAGVTLLHLVEALFIALVAGVLIGTAEGLSDKVRAALKPVMIIVRSLPMIILVILTMSALAYSRVPVATGTIVLIPIISEAVSEGIRSIEPEMKDAYLLNGGFSLRVLLYVYLPLISGYIRQAFFNAAGVGLKVIVSAEYLVQTRNSLGKAVYSSSYFLDYAEVYAYAFFMVMMVLIITELPALLINRIEKNSLR